MRQRGRKRGDDLPMNVIDGDFAGRRPDPPDDLTPRQITKWVAIVNDEPADYFATAATQGMLKSLCQSLVTLEKLNVVINDFKDAWLKNGKGAKLYTEYIKARALEVRNCAQLTTKLRLTNQSRYTPRAAGSASANTLKGSKPWEWDPPFK